jgi:uncharacterized phage protein (TIGR02220 family)
MDVRLAPDDHSFGNGMANGTGVGMPAAPKAKPPGRRDEQAEVEAAAFIDWFNRNFNRAFEVRKDLVRLVRVLLDDRYTQRDLRAVAWLKKQKWSADPKMAQYLVPLSILRRDKFGEYLDQAREEFPKFFTSNGVAAESSSPLRGDA